MADLSLPPNSQPAEEALLGSILIDPFCFGDVDKIIKTPTAFFMTVNGWVYKAIKQVSQRHDNIDLLTVAAELSKDRLLDEIGGEGYLANLINSVPTALNVLTYAQIVADRFAERRMLAAASEIARLAYDGLVGSDEKRAKAKAALMEAFEGTERNQRKTWDQTVDDTLAEMYERVWGESQEFFTTGISDLDAMLGESLEPGKMIIVAAKRKRGKSTFMRGMALTNAKQGKPISIFSCEEREHNIAKTMLSREALSTVSTYALRQMVHKEGREAEAASIYNRLLQKGNALKQMPISAVYAAGMTVDDMTSEMERLRDVSGTRLFVVDYAQRIKEAGKRERRLELARIGLELSNAATRLGVTILLGSQVNDEGRTREAEDLENETDAKLSIQVDETTFAAKSSDGIPVRLVVELNRNGPSGEVSAIFNGAHRVFASATTAPLGNAYKD